MATIIVETSSDLPEGLVRKLQSAQRIVVLTGAGVSAESGIPTFRDKLSGLWSLYTPSKLANADAFLRDPDLVWGWYISREKQVEKASPNAGHYSIAELERRRVDFQLITQNVDNLHERAGSGALLHLHGELARPRCFNCGKQYLEMPEETLQNDLRISPPRCKTCGGLIRPGVVWFGEELPQDVHQAAIEKSSNCDFFLCVGTSSLVYPAAELPLIAKRSGATLCVVNIKSTPIDRNSDYVLRGSASTVLPLLVSEVKAQFDGQ